MVGGPDLIDVIGAIVGGDVPTDERLERAAKMLGVSVGLVDAALAYYAEFTDDVDQLMAELANDAVVAEAAWRRQQELLDR